MRIGKIKLTDFKRFKDLTIDLGAYPAKVVALVGPNGSGKSSVFDAFEEKLKEQKGANYNPPAAFLWRGLYTGADPVGDYIRSQAIQITASDGATQFGRQSFYIRSSYRFTPRLDIKELREQPDILQDQTRPSSSSDLDTRLTENYQRLQGNLITEYEQGTKSGVQFREEQVGRLNEILAKVLDVRVSSLGSIVSGRGKLFFEKGTSKNFPYDNLSAGEKEVIDIVLDLIVKTAQFNDTVYAIDEPELHLNTAIQRSLVVEIEKLVPENCQLWVATHSVGFLRALQVELRSKTAIIDLSGVNLDETVTLKPMPTTRKNWQRIFETALDDLTGLVAPRTIVYCEGRAEPDNVGNEQGLDADVYNAIFGPESPDVLFVSSGGSTEPQRYSAIALLTGR